MWWKARSSSCSSHSRIETAALDAAAVVLRSISNGIALTAAGLVLAGLTLKVAPGRAARLAGALLVPVAAASAVLLWLRLGAVAEPGWLWSAPGAALLLLALGGGILAGNRRAAPGLALLGAGTLLAAFGVSGHAAARGGLAPALLLLHVGAAAWWTGGLWLLLVKGRTVSGMAAILTRFSGQAPWIVLLLFLAGLLEAVLLLDGSVDLARAYDRSLLWKVGLAAALLSVAAVNRWLLTPALHVPQLRRNIGVELLLIVAIVTATAWLTVGVGLHRTSVPAPALRIVATLDGLEIGDPWVTATIPGSRQSAGYLILRNLSADSDRLLGASSAQAARISLHQNVVEQGLVKMRSIPAVDVPARAETAMVSGGFHLMLDEPVTSLVEGDAVLVNLDFERRGTVEVLFLVQRGTAHANH